MFLGIDIGSSSSKAVLLSKEGSVLAAKVVNLGIGTEGPEKVLLKAFTAAEAERSDVLYTVVTGYGRMSYPDADKQITEITCHAAGVHFLLPEARTIIDIGGQDAKVIRLGRDGSVENFVMNEKCAAGTGRFLEVMARVLGRPIEELADLADNATRQVSISSVCTVFAESEVISHLADNKRREDVALGAHTAIAKRIAGMSMRAGVEPVLAMTGGVALNRAMPKALERELGFPIVLPENPQTTGALGAATLARKTWLKAVA
ncbi:MAG: acyl-CoA dehydratase activase [Desulfovibrio sp.]|jgi:predicted CoA-substrate-specific enzyme activase|nr:acyl-CoA dehydratase activase [Desulfovibrio sp.]